MKPLNSAVDKLFLILDFFADYSMPTVYSRKMQFFIDLSKPAVYLKVTTVKNVSGYYESWDREGTQYRFTDKKKNQTNISDIKMLRSSNWKQPWTSFSGHLKPILNSAEQFVTIEMQSEALAPPVLWREHAYKWHQSPV